MSRTNATQNLLSPIRNILFLLVVVANLFDHPSFAFAQDPTPEQEAFFESRIRPILVSRCFRCHGGEREAGGLRVDSREALIQGGESGEAIKPGDANATLLLKAIDRVADVAAMPPDKPLSEQEVADLKSWIEQGAIWPSRSTSFAKQTHWSLQPISNPTPPTATNTSWIQTPIDSFIAAKLETKGMPLPAKATKPELLRRITYDLTGLPPTAEEMRSFLADESANAIDKVIDRLLDSARYGEHWGRHWLDVVRYADTAGENSDHPLPEAWRYRNWVIQSIQNDLPYDQFVREQLAGDLIAKQTPSERSADQIVATGYWALARRFGHDIDKDIHLTYEDAIDTMGKSLLGLTIGCSRCHDHKYDPITAKDYYALYGVLASTKFSFPGCEPAQQPRDLIPLLDSQSVEKLRQWEEQFAQVDAEQKKLNELLSSHRLEIPTPEKPLGSLLCMGEIGNGGKAEWEIQGADKDGIAVKQGEWIALEVTPLSNHGADTTQFEFSLFDEASGKKWDQTDLLQQIEQGNPRSDMHGNSNVWFYLDGANGTLLNEYVDTIEGNNNLRAWRSGDTPSFLAQLAETPINVWTTLAPRSLFLHPGRSGSIFLGWLAPADLRVQIKGMIADAHPTGPDGVGFRVWHIATDGVKDRLQSMAQLRQQTAELNAKKQMLLSTRPQMPMAYAVAEGQVANARLHKRGEPNDLGDEVPRRFLEIQGGTALGSPQESGRKELADAICSPNNPLTARVIVNRVWNWHFGRGLVATPNDFGSRGSPPTHPELLDYLANDFIANGWSLNKLHRTIMLSSAYQQKSTSTPDWEVLAGFQRRRLTAEELRDTLLLVSGQLDVTPGEAHPFPPTNVWGFTQHTPFASEYPTNKRSVFVMQKRNRRDRFFTLFDGADPNASTPAREATVVPTQALFFMNDPLVSSSCEKIADSILAQTNQIDEIVQETSRRLFARDATDIERSEGANFIREANSGVASDAAQLQLRSALVEWLRIMIATNELLYVD